ncbi:MAG: hypothetical protein RBT63_02935, partial [Bdellovibrionales bacterium]|nr:hypothetical protein [Bdellovibrionales bacterium]
MMKSRKSLLFVVQTVLLVVIATSSTLAEAKLWDEKKVWVGGSAGILVPNRSTTTSRPQYGVNVGAMLGSELAFGAYYFASRKDEAGIQGKFDLEFYGVEGAFHFEGEA